MLTKVHLVKAMTFPVVLYRCDIWTIKKAEHWRTDASELWCWRRLESPLDCKEIQLVHPKGDQSLIFIGRTYAQAETPPDVKNWLIGKDPDDRKDWRQEEKAMTEDEMVGWHHWLDDHEFEQAPGFGDGQGSLACYSPWGHKQLDMTKQLNWIECSGKYKVLQEYMPSKPLIVKSSFPTGWASSAEMHKASRNFHCEGGV